MLNDCVGPEAHVGEGNYEQGGAGDPQEAVAGGDEGQHEGIRINGTVSRDYRNRIKWLDTVDFTF